MVTQATAFSKTGVSDWIIQRVSAGILAAYTICVVSFVLINSPLDYMTWHNYFTNPAMEIFTMLALLSTCAHAWIGMWTIGSDYLQEHTLGERATFLRSCYQISCILVILAYLLWGIDILWGN